MPREARLLTQTVCFRARRMLSLRGNSRVTAIRNFTEHLDETYLSQFEEYIPSPIRSFQKYPPALLATLWILFSLAMGTICNWYRNLRLSSLSDGKKQDEMRSCYKVYHGDIICQLLDDLVDFFFGNTALVALLLTSWLFIGYSNRFLGFCCISLLFTSSFHMFGILVKWLSNQSRVMKWLSRVFNQAWDGVVNFLAKYPPVPVGLLGSLIFGSIGFLSSRYFFGAFGIPPANSGEKNFHSSSDTYPTDFLTLIKLIFTYSMIMSSACIAIHVPIYLVASLIVDCKRRFIYSTCISSTTYLSASTSLCLLLRCLGESYFENNANTHGT